MWVVCVGVRGGHALAYKIGDLDEYVAIDVIEFARTHNTELSVVCVVCVGERVRLAYKIGDLDQLTRVIP